MDNNTITPNENFLRSAAQGNTASLGNALKDGANANSLTPDGDNALHLACAFGHADLIATLLDAGTNPNAKNKEGLTPAHEAVINIRPRCLGQLLKSSKLDLRIEDSKGLTAQQTAVRSLQPLKEAGYAR